MKGVSLFGWLTCAFGSFAALMVVTHLGEATAQEATIRFAASAALALAGLVIARRAARIAPRIDPQQAEREILKAARAHGGRITAAEVAAETAVPLAQASEMLEALSGRGLCRMSVAEVGILVFEFPELEPPEPAPDDNSETAQSRAAAQARAAQRSSS